MKSKSATLEDVARHAGVSYQTVSRVLNKSANVSKATRSKVEKSIEELRYYREAVFRPQPGLESAELKEIAARHQVSGSDAG